MNAWGITDKGLVRALNQDAFFLHVLHEDGQAVLVVCDGMGGARAGEVASETAVDAFVEEVRRALKPGMDAAALKELLAAAVAHANDVVFRRASSEEYAGMGTTLVAALVSGRQVAVANVGDSRAYRIGPQGITRVTKDHSLVEDLFSKGNLTYEEARSHPSKNLITRALGTDAIVDCDLFSFAFSPGEYVLLCSDGLTNVVEDQEILYETLHGGQPAHACTQLLELACARGGPDNITVALISL
ncbi:MAG: Stp1/IreP family PP2C-type Ser/Thr phosphatase [Oscillospiraceae bacterium]|nr:Stp1/IreP family PP2C-type Ser/Thr phosphatase [Oscillospiraceae bacterium]